MAAAFIFILKKRSVTAWPFTSYCYFLNPPFTSIAFLRRFGKWTYLYLRRTTLGTDR
jgi:hypothetical protein